MQLIDDDAVIKLRNLITENANNESFINDLINGGDSMYLVLEMIIDGTIEPKYIKNMLSMFENSDSWDDFQTYLDFGVLEGELKITDYKSS